MERRQVSRGDLRAEVLIAHGRPSDGSTALIFFNAFKLAMTPGHFVAGDAEAQPETCCEISRENITEIMRSKINAAESDGDNKRNRDDHQANPKHATRYHQTNRVG